jgi:hypothetical protein
LVEKPEEKRQLGIRGCRWQDNIKMDFREIEWVIWTGFILPRIGTRRGLL